MDTSPSACPNIDRRPMFPLFTQQLILNIYKRSYRTARFGDCARYVSFMAGQPPPATLLPDGTRLNVLPED